MNQQLGKTNVVNSAAKRNKKIEALSLSALFAALIASGAFITIPLPVTPVPVSIQNFFALLSGLALGPVYGSAAVLLYLLAGAVGLPVFAGATGGIVHFLAPSGGYLLGYLLCAFTAGLIMGAPKNAQKKPLEFLRLAFAALLGLSLVYIPGLLWLKTITASDWQRTVAIGFVPFIIGDSLKLVLAFLVVPRIRRLTSRVFGR